MVLRNRGSAGSFLFRGFGGSVDGADAEGHGPESGVGEADRLHQCGHVGTAGDGRDALGQVGVGAVVARDGATEHGNDAAGVEVIERPDGGRRGDGELDDKEGGAGAHDAIHLAVAAGDVLKVADAEGDGDAVKRLVGERQVEAVTEGELDDVALGRGAGLTAADAEHALGDVDTGDRHGVETLGHQHGEVASAGGDVENVVDGAAGTQHPDGPAAPQAVETEGHGAVHQVVGRGDVVKHSLDLQAL